MLCKFRAGRASLNHMRTAPAVLLTLMFAGCNRAPQSVKVDPSLESLTVEYDATRLRPAEVESALTGAGIPVVPA